MAVDLTLAEDLVGGLDVVLEGGLRVVSEKQRLMRSRHFVPFVPDRLEVIGQKSDRVFGSILDHLCREEEEEEEEKVKIFRQWGRTAAG